jgi:hypothetical protein
MCDLIFRREATLSVTVVLVRSAPAGIRDPRRLATLAVTDSTARDLDELMRLYRAGPQRASTGGTDLTLTQVRNGSVIAFESLPNTPTIYRIGDYGFSALISQARKEAPPGALSGEYR